MHDISTQPSGAASSEATAISKRPQGDLRLLADPVAYDLALINYLLTKGTVSEQAMDRAQRVRAQDSAGLSLADLLARLGLAAERDLAQAATDILGLPLVEANDYPDVPLFEDKLPLRFLLEFRVIPIATDEAGIELAMANPVDTYGLDALRMQLGRPLNARPGVPVEIEAAINRLYGNKRVASDLQSRSDDESGFESSVDLDVERLKDQASEAPVIRLVNQIIADAVDQRASDIHFEPFENHLALRYRVDGTLRESDKVPDRHRLAVISRLKILAKLNIAERRLPQDGRIKLSVRGKAVDLRVATGPTLHGESVVLRILDRHRLKLDFTELGLAGDTLARFRSTFNRPNGIVLVTGPTGSGKTTTLYTALSELNDHSRKILTVEDPVEYQFDGINQVQVKPQIGLDFASTLRSFLRQDPDIIMVGEIRDTETAEIAVQAALTGHLVLSTLHTNGAAASIARLLDMGVKDYLLTSTINGIAAQRLVRRLCPHCRAAYQPLPELARQVGIAQPANGRTMTFYRPTGCPQCHGTGYRGRTLIFETLVMTDGLRQLVLAHAEAPVLARAAIAEGMTTMYQHGLEQALAGITSIEDVLLATGEA